MSRNCEENCEGCPSVYRTRLEQHTIEQVAAGIGEHAMSSAVDDMAKVIYETTKEIGGELLAINRDGEVEVVDSSSPDDVASAARIQTAAFLQSLETEKERLGQQAAAIKQGCTGPLKMRATRDNQTVTVSVCMSPMAPEGGSVELVQVDRTAKPAPRRSFFKR